MPAVLLDPLLPELANNFAFPAIVGQGLKSALLILLPGPRSPLLAFWAQRRARSAATRRRPSARAGDLPRPPRPARDRDRRPRRLVDRRDRLRRPRLGQVHQLRPRHRHRRPRPKPPAAAASSSGKSRWKRSAKSRSLGHGAGTYQFAWDQLRPLAMTNTQAHSLYLQALDELGIVGGLLALGMVLFLLWVGFTAWRAAGGRERELYAVLLGVSLAFAVGVAYDWFWQIGGGRLGLLPGDRGAGRGPLRAALAGARRGPGARRRRGRGEPGSRRFGLTVAGLAVAWLTHAGADRPAAGRPRDRTTRPTPSNAATLDERDRATPNTARSIEPWAATPYLPARPARRRRRANTERRSAASSRRSTARTTTGRSTTCAPAPSTRRAERSRPGRPGGSKTPQSTRNLPLPKGLKVVDDADAGHREDRRRAARRRRRRARGGRRRDARTRAGRPARAERAGGLAPARRAAAPAAGAGRLDGADRRPLRGHRGDLLDRRRRPLLGGPLQPQLDPRGEAPRPLRPRPPADPPLDPRRGALAGLGDGAGDAGARRPAGDQPGRAALAEKRDRARRRHPGRQPSSCAASCAGSGTGRRRWRSASWSARPPPSTPSPAASSPTRRRASTWSATSPPRPRRTRPSCPASAASPTSPRSPGSTGIERVVVTEQQMSEPAAERLIEECKEAGPGAHLPAPALRPARPGDRAEPPRRAAGPRLPLLRPAALDPGDEAGDGHRRLRPPPGRSSRRSCCWPRWRS